MSNAVPQVPAGLFTIVTRTLDSLGFSPDQLLELAGMPRWHHLDAGEMVSGHHYYRIMDWSARYLGDEEFGARIPQHAPIISMGALGSAIRRSKSLYDAINSINKEYGQAANVAQFFTINTPTETHWCFKHLFSQDDSVHQVNLATLQYMIDTVRLAAGPDWRPSRIHLARGKMPGQDHLEIFRDREIVYFQGMSGISIKKSLLPCQIPRERLKAGAESSGWSEIETPPDSFTGSLRLLLKAHIREGIFQISSLAEAVGMSKRTLQRRLGEEGLSFSVLLDDLRFELTAELMRELDYPLIAIAHDLGYRDQAHFTRSFRRWTGMSPSEYRSHLQI
ncbi:MAG: helix-turn-helix domain-containing protein [Methyloceanibacter sp.]